MFPCHEEVAVSVVLFVKASHRLLLQSRVSCAIAVVVGSKVGLGELGVLWVGSSWLISDGGPDGACGRSYGMLTAAVEITDGNQCSSE